MTGVFLWLSVCQWKAWKLHWGGKEGKALGFLDTFLQKLSNFSSPHSQYGGRLENVLLYTMHFVHWYYFISRLSVWLFRNSLGQKYLLSSAQLRCFLLCTSRKTFDIAYLVRKGVAHSAPSALGTFLYSSSWGCRGSSAMCLFTSFTALFTDFQGMCCEPDNPRNRDGSLSFAFPQMLDCPSWDCSSHFGSVTPKTVLQLRLISKAEIPHVLPLYSCGIAKHILRQIFVLCLRNTALIRAK